MISRIRPTPRKAPASVRVAGYIFLAIISLSLIYGVFFRGVEAHDHVPRFDDPALIYLMDQNVNFIYASPSDSITILRDADGTYKAGFNTPRAVCDKLAENARVVSQVIFHYPGKLPPESVDTVSCR